MKEINVAYSTLSDEVARIDYNKKLDAESKTSTKSRADTARKKPNQQTAAGNSSIKVDFKNIHGSFESFFGFNPKTHEVTNEDKLNTFSRDKKK